MDFFSYCTVYKMFVNFLYRVCLINSSPVCITFNLGCWPLQSIGLSFYNEGAKSSLHNMLKRAKSSTCRLHIRMRNIYLTTAGKKNDSEVLPIIKKKLKYWVVQGLEILCFSLGFGSLMGYYARPVNVRTDTLGFLLCRLRFTQD